MASAERDKIVARRMRKLTFEQPRSPIPLLELFHHMQDLFDWKKHQPLDFYAPFIPIYQSSGAGKTQLLVDLERIIPAVTVVVRRDDVGGFPRGDEGVEAFFSEWISIGKACDTLIRLDPFKDGITSTSARNDKNLDAPLQSLCATMWEHASALAFLQALLDRCLYIFEQNAGVSASKALQEHFPWPATNAGDASRKIRSKTFGEIMNKAKTLREDLMKDSDFAQALGDDSDCEKWIFKGEEIHSYMEPLVDVLEKLMSLLTTRSLLNMEGYEEFRARLTAETKCSQREHPYEQQLPSSVQLEDMMRTNAPLMVNIDGADSLLEDNFLQAPKPPEPVIGPSFKIFPPRWPYNNPREIPQPFCPQTEDTPWEAGNVFEVPATEWTNPRRMLEFGRGLWRTYKNLDLREIRSMLDTRLGFRYPARMGERYLANFAVLSSIVNLRIETNSIRSLDATAELVNSHLRATVDANQNGIITTQWSEPIVAWAAANILHGDWQQPLQSLNENWIKRGFVTPRENGAIAGRILLAHANESARHRSLWERHDPECERSKDVWEDRCRYVSVKGFIHELVCDNRFFGHKEFDHDEIDFQQLLDGHVNFNHFLEVSEEDLEENLKAVLLSSWQRCAAILTPANHQLGDAIIVVNLGDMSAPLSPENLTIIFCKFENRADVVPLWEWSGGSAHSWVPQKWHRGSLTIGSSEDDPKLMEHLNESYLGWRVNPDSPHLVLLMDMGANEDAVVVYKADRSIAKLGHSSLWGLHVRGIKVISGELNSEIQQILERASENRIRRPRALDYVIEDLDSRRTGSDQDARDLPDTVMQESLVEESMLDQRTDI